MSRIEGFTVYKHRFVIRDTQLITRQFVVLKRTDGTLQFTNFHRYIKSPVRRVKKYTNDGNSRFFFVIQFLNYAFFRAGIKRLDDMTVDVIRDFLNTGSVRLAGEHFRHG